MFQDLFAQNPKINVELPSNKHTTFDAMGHNYIGSDTQKINAWSLAMFSVDSAVK